MIWGARFFFVEHVFCDCTATRAVYDARTHVMTDSVLACQKFSGGGALVARFAATAQLPQEEAASPCRAHCRVAARIYA